jgi:DNA mismatch repair protein MutS2
MMNSNTASDSRDFAPCAVDPSGHARRVLEFDKVLRAAAACARTDGGRQLVEGLLPSDDGDAVAAEHVVVGEVLRQLEAGASPWSFDGAPDIRAAVRDAVRPGAVLDAGDLRCVAATLEVAGRLRRGLDAQPDRWPHLAARVAHLGQHDAVVKAIHAVLDERGELRDSASPALRTIRRELLAGREALRTRLEALLQKTGAATDPYVTLRGERYVVPVRADTAGSVRGIVHDRSATGQTLFVEPLDAVDANNDLQRLRDAEQREVRRILQELTGRVAADAARIEPSLDAMDTLDAIQARALWAHANDAHAPRWGARVALRAARHPLLDAQLRAAGGAVVPLDLEMAGARALVITGPNTGGKTVALKTVGVLSLLAQAGVPIPAAADSELPMFTRVVADIGD